KVFEEERELTVMLLVDVSGSENFGTRKQFKQDMITELCAVLAFSAIQNNDKIGVLFFSDIVEKFIPPKKGKSHILHIIRELIEFKPKSTKTNITQALRYFTNAIKKKSIAFVISDFMDSGFSDALKIASGKHDVIALRIYDKRERELPDMGLIKVKDAESGTIQWLDTSSKSVRNHYYAAVREREKMIKDIFLRSGVDTASIATDESYIGPLTTLFKSRAK
ncbi:MAG TPA: VWA domain-containing protein, partial [Bacteroidia bacterium]|nr:VWA domain-containing protein [Bacteroidia bacterium]